MSNPIPDAHDTKFDRQMRLWGGHGQAKLEGAKLCVIGSSATASETLKNLVLPNVGSFDLIDSAIVQPIDVGNNFFVNESDLNQSRAEAVVRSLTELNPECKGHAIQLSNQTIDQYIDANIDSFNQYSCVLICQQAMSKSIFQLVDRLFESNIPVLIARSYGMIGSLRVIKREHLIVESHPANDRRDLYIHPEQVRHWPEYQQFLKSFCFVDQPKQSNASNDQVVDDTTPIAVDDDGPVTHADESVSLSQTTINQSNNQYLNGDGKDSELHAHIPYVAILHEALERWSAKNPSNNQSIKQSMPTTYEAQQSFKQSIKELSWDFGNETNFAEAYDFASRAYHLPTLDSSTLAVYKDPKATIDQSNSQSINPFWLCVAGVNAFIASEGHGVCLPVSIDLPDMHSKTEWYVKLKQIFKNKADADLQSVIKHVRTIEQSIKQSNNQTPVTDAYISYFVKNCRTLRVVRTRSLAQEYGLQSNNQSIDESNEQSNEHFTEQINEIIEEASFESMDQTDQPEQQFVIPHPPIIHWYLSLRACDMFHDKHGRYPGLLTHEEEQSINQSDDEPIDQDGSSQWEKDGQEVAELCSQLIASNNLTCAVEVDCCVEMSRSGACEPHVTAAYVGGVAAQEALKLLLEQYVPINHTFIYNGIHTEAKSFNL